MESGTGAEGVPGAGRRCRVPRRRVRSEEGRPRRSRVQHRHERLPGDTYRPLLRRAVRHPHHRRGRQLRRQPRRHREPGIVPLGPRHRRPNRTQQLAQRKEPRRVSQRERRAGYLRRRHARAHIAHPRTRKQESLSLRRRPRSPRATKITRATRNPRTSSASRSTRSTKTTRTARTSRASRIARTSRKGSHRQGAQMARPRRTGLRRKGNLR